MAMVACGGTHTSDDAKPNEGESGGSANASGGDASGGDASGGDASGGDASVGTSGASTGGASTGGAGGTGATTATGGSGPLPPVDKVDLLLVIDNSLSMTDKQGLLREAIPELVERLASPACRDAAGDIVARPIADGPCPAGTTEEFAPIHDLHVGVMSTSLGGHGGIACSPASGTSWGPEDDDRGELVAPLRGVPSFDGLGFVALDTGASPAPGTTSSVPALLTDLDAIVASVGDTGCGYEATLEAWYRFLVEPMPPTEVVQLNSTSVAQGHNSVLLAQRAAFLRPDSLLGIVMLTDENDCSVRDDGPGYFIAGASASGRLPRATSVCAVSPNDPCCRSCALYESTPPAGCSALAADPGCSVVSYTSVEDHANVRCYEQKRRFGLDFLYPITKYVQALTEPEVYGRACVTDADCPNSPQQPAGGQCLPAGGSSYCRYPNPLFSANALYPGLTPRPGPERIYLAGIVGVPWQDVATTASLASPLEHELVSGRDGSLAARWDLILGDPLVEPPVPPADPFMWESITPRIGVHPLSQLPFPVSNPLTGDSIQPPSAPGGASPINGHEYDVLDNGDLQFACVVPLPTPRECAEGITTACDCKATDPSLATKPLCQAPSSTTAGITQYYAKAYPGLRHLAALEGFGPNAIVGSICPATTASPSAAGYGYRPVINAIVARMKEQLPSP